MRKVLPIPKLLVATEDFWGKIKGTSFNAITVIKIDKVGQVPKQAQSFKYKIQLSIINLSGAIINRSAQSELWTASNDHLDLL